MKSLRDLALRRLLGAQRAGDDGCGRVRALVPLYCAVLSASGVRRTAAWRPPTYEPARKGLKAHTGPEDEPNEGSLCKYYPKQGPVYK
jgi:hypothetical protein